MKTFAYLGKCGASFEDSNLNLALCGPVLPITLVPSISFVR